MLVDGKWVQNWQPVQATDAKGGFVRQTSTFRRWITPDGSPGPDGQAALPAEKGRYHLFAALICPWASRALMARKLKRLDDFITVSIVRPELSDQGWQFDPASPDDIRGSATYLHELYSRADPKISGRATVPVLWDRATQTIVNNESADILRIFNSAFAAIAPPAIDLYPAELRRDIDTLNEEIYPALNNGVYRAGFATTQAAYDEAYAAVFAELDNLESRLKGRTFLFGEHFTETDIRLFVTLVRFDAAYHGLFKCNKRRLADYPALSAYLVRVLALPGVRETVNVDHIKRGYYSIKALNPNGIVPRGPDLPFQ